MKSPCMFTFSKRFAHGRESAVVNESFSRKARDFFVAIPRDGKVASFTSLSFAFFSLLFSIACLAVKFGLPASGVIKSLKSMTKDRFTLQITTKRQQHLSYNFCIRHSLMMLSKL